MKRCENCFESNSDGATNCVICGDPLDVPQIVGDRATSVDVRHFDPPTAEADVIIEEDDDTEEKTIEGTAPDTFHHVAPDPTPMDDPVLVDIEDDPLDEDTEVPEPMFEDETGSAVPPVAHRGGAVALQVFHDTEPRVVHTHAVVNDITLVGREDPQRDVFPDLDLGKLPRDQVASSRASRQHMRLLRQGQRYYVYVYKGTTGTQVCDRMIDPDSYGKRFEIQVGDRIILGGKVRMKLARVE